MISEEDFKRSIVGIVIAVLLVLNPILLPSLPVNLTYHITATEMQPDVSTAVEAANRGNSSLAIECQNGTMGLSRSCLFERRIGPNGSLALDGRALDGAVESNHSSYDYVAFSNGLYETRAARPHPNRVLICGDGNRP